jgi:type II secretory ATPase GspE/PulE/Tfp pilus assembly ATPase PilB-like protein
LTRLLDLGIPGFMIASSVTAILAQRLVRCLCSCRAPAGVSLEMGERMASFGLAHPVDSLYAPVGCDACDQTGYRGRTGIYELLVFDDAIREAVREEEKGDQLRALAQSAGMKLMQEDALDKILRGITSVNEVARVVPIQTAPSAACLICGQRGSRSFLYCPHCGARQHHPASSQSTKSGKRTPEVVTKP